MRFTVTTPVAGYSGKVGGVTFVDGQATVDEDTHAAELAYFRAQGYGVTDEHTEPDLDALRAEATELGIKRAGNKSAERLEAEIAEARAAQTDNDDTTAPSDEPGNDEETQP